MLNELPTPNLGHIHLNSTRTPGVSGTFSTGVTSHTKVSSFTVTVLPGHGSHKYYTLWCCRGTLWVPTHRVWAWYPNLKVPVTGKEHFEPA